MPKEIWLAEFRTNYSNWSKRKIKIKKGIVKILDFKVKWQVTFNNEIL